MQQVQIEARGDGEAKVRHLSRVLDYEIDAIPIAQFELFGTVGDNHS